MHGCDGARQVWRLLYAIGHSQRVAHLSWLERLVPFDLLYWFAEHGGDRAARSRAMKALFLQREDAVAAQGHRFGACAT